MTNKFSKLSISVAASAVIMSNAFALDPSITNFGFSPTSGQATIFDIANPSKVKTITTNAGGFTIAPSGASAYMTADSGTIVKINFYNGSKTVVSNTGYADITMSPDQTKLYALKSDGTLDVISTATNTVINTYSTFSSGTSAYPITTTITPDGSKVLVGDYSASTFTVLNTITGTRSAPITVGDQSEAIAISADGTKAYTVGFNSDTVTVIDLTSNTVVGSFATSWSPGGIALSPDGTKIYVSGNGAGRPLQVFSATDYSLLQSVDTNMQIQMVSVSPDGSKIYVKASNDHKILVIDASTYAVSEYAINSNQDHSAFIGSNLITGTLEVPDLAYLQTEGFTNSVNFAGGTLRATGSFTLSNPVYLHDAFNLTWDDSTTFTAVAGGTVDTNGYNVEFSGEVSGVGGLTKTGAGTLTLSGTNTYTGDTTINAGTLTLNGGNAIIDTGAVVVNTGAILNVASAETVGSVSGAGNITLGTDLTTGGNNTDDTLSGILSGSGGVTKEGTGTLTLSGANTYTGATEINGGTLAITGDTSTSAFSVNNGGTLAGSGTVGDTTVLSGGKLAPSGVSTLTISGDLVMNAGSTLGINAYANGTNSKVATTGTATINGGTVTVHSDSAGTWNTSTDYTILTATGGVTGTFTSVTDDLAFLDPTLTYGANDVMLNLTRNSTTYASKGTNSYSAGVGGVLDTIGAPNADMQTLLNVLNGTNDAGAAAMLTQLSGAPLGSLAHLSPTQTRSFAMSLFNRMSGGGASGGIGLASLAFADNSDMATTFRYLVDAGAIGPNGFQEPQKIGDAEMWIRAVGGRTMTDGDASRNIADSTTTTGGLQAGIDKRSGEWMIGGSLGYLHSNSDQSGFDGETDSYQLGLYASQESKEYRISFNAIGGKYNNTTSRTTPTGTASADFDGTALSAEVKAAYKVPLNSGWSMEPTIGGWVQRYAQDGYSESGASGSNLSIDKATFTSQALTTELKLIHIFGESKEDKGTFETSLGYTRESGDINAPLVGRFSAAPSAGSFSIASADRGRDVLTAMVGGDITVAAHTRLFALVNGNWRENESGYSAVAGVKIGF